MAETREVSGQFRPNLFLKRISPHSLQPWSSPAYSRALGPAIGSLTPSWAQERAAPSANNTAATTWVSRSTLPTFRSLLKGSSRLTALIFRSGKALNSASHRSSSPLPPDGVLQTSFATQGHP